VIEYDWGKRALEVNAAGALELVGHIRANGGFTQIAGRGHANGRARYFASVFAVSGDADLLYAVLDRYGSFDDMLDLCACWAQELVLRGVDVGGPQLDELASWLVARGHALAHLPMHRLPLERDSPTVPMVARANGATGWWSGIQPWERPRMEVEATIPIATDVTVASDARIAAAFESHCEVSNGKSEYRVYALDPPAPRPADPGLLASLGADCMRGTTPATTAATVLAPPEVYATILAYAANGGDYNLAWSGAYGRRDTWRSLAGLTGTSGDAGLEVVEAAVRAAHWTWLLPHSTWFFGVVTDLAIACVSPRGEALALLAGSDTD